MEHDSKRHVFAIFCLFLESIKKIAQGDPHQNNFSDFLKTLSEQKKYTLSRNLRGKLTIEKYYPGALYGMVFQFFSTYHSGAIFGMVFQF